MSISVGRNLNHHENQTIADFQKLLDCTKAKLLSANQGKSKGDFWKSFEVDVSKAVEESTKDNDCEEDSLWWYSPNVQEVSSQDIDEQIFAESLINSRIHFWSELSKKEKDHYKAEMLIKSPKVILGDYNNACKWFLKVKGIINPSFRDTFSAGGQESIFGVKVPKIIANIYKWKSDIIEVLNNSDSPNDSFELWKEHINKMTKFPSDEKKVLLDIFSEIGKEVR